MTNVLWSCFIAAHVSLDTAAYDGKPVSRLTDATLGNMEPGQQLSKTVYIKNLQIGDRMVFVKVKIN